MVSLSTTYQHFKVGAASIQLKQVAQGKDPRDMTAPGFWGEAFFQGGGLGIFGDFSPCKPGVVHT